MPSQTDFDGDWARTIAYEAKSVPRRTGMKNRLCIGFFQFTLYIKSAGRRPTLQKKRREWPRGYFAALTVTFTWALVQQHWKPPPPTPELSVRTASST